MKSPIKRAMVMAAGLGTRLSPFTNFQTKALLPVMGVPIAQYAVDSLVYAEVEQLVVNVHHQGTQVSEGMAALDHGSSRLMISDESRQLLGSAGGIKKAVSIFGSNPFYLVNADVLCDVNWSELAACHQRLREKFGVVLTLTVFLSGPPGAKYREIHFDSAKGLITSLGELVEGRPYFIGAAILEPEALSAVPEGVPSDFVESVLRPAISTNRAGVSVSQGPWFDMGDPKLWLKTHLTVIEMMEQRNGRVNSGSSSHWNERVVARAVQNNLRLSEGIWTSRNSVVGDWSKWAQPCYWNANQQITAPQTLGPKAVLYGPCVEGKEYNRGIGFGGKWVEI
ncbi:MAG: sugar phosphate nucleotidyltransferase [Bdellovibrionia bacterium]